jgi:GNAT superfamily N-acetyltransferase
VASNLDSSWTILRVTRADFDVLLPLVRAYCEFYDVAPSDSDLRTMFTALAGDPQNEGVQLIAWDEDGRPVGFATVYWSWSTAHAARIGVLNDLFVIPDARGRGAAEALIAASVEQCRRRGADQLSWQTAPDNHRAQRVYDRIGATREQWVDYHLAVPRAAD